MEKKILVILATLTALVFLYGCTEEKQTSKTIASTQTAAVEMTAATETYVTEATVTVQVPEERDIQLGLQSGNVVEIVCGLEPGEVIII